MRRHRNYCDDDPYLGLGLIVALALGAVFGLVAAAILAVLIAIDLVVWLAVPAYKLFFLATAVNPGVPKFDCTRTVIGAVRGPSQSAELVREKSINIVITERVR